MAASWSIPWQGCTAGSPHTAVGAATATRGSDIKKVSATTAVWSWPRCLLWWSDRPNAVWSEADLLTLATKSWKITSPIVEVPCVSPDRDGIRMAPFLRTHPGLSNLSLFPTSYLHTEEICFCPVQDSSTICLEKENSLGKPQCTRFAFLGKYWHLIFMVFSGVFPLPAIIIRCCDTHLSCHISMALRLDEKVAKKERMAVDLILYRTAEESAKGNKMNIAFKLLNIDCLPP